MVDCCALNVSYIQLFFVFVVLMASEFTAAPWVFFSLQNYVRPSFHVCAHTIYFFALMVI